MPSLPEEQRVNEALKSLVMKLQPVDATKAQLDDGILLMREILDRPAGSTDVHHAGDLIKKDLIRNHPTPEKALRFSSLYSRYIQQDIIKRKLDVLHFLKQLTDLTINTRQSGRSQHPATRQRERAVVSETEDTSKHFASNDSQPSQMETSLMRDMPFVFQGISSSHLKFQGSTKLTLPVAALPKISGGLLHALAEPSLLYKSLAAFIDLPGDGLLRQSLKAAFGEELRSYLRIVTTLEGQIRQAMAYSAPDASGVTLRKLVVWMRKPTRSLRLLNWISEESAGKKGGQIISLIHGLALTHGDPSIGANAETLLAPVTRPFYEMLRHWIYDGELSDPYGEFFVIEQDPNELKAADEGRGRGAANSLWEDKFKLNREMIPSIITEKFAEKVFLIGKSLNFIRYSCGDSLWVEQYSKAASKELRYGDTQTLETWIDEAHKTTMARLVHLMDTKFHLFKHLKALKNYLLLGQGDFVTLLMDSLATHLDRPAGAQFRHTLTAQLETAIRGSNAQYDSAEVLRRLDARMLQLSHGELGWDCFTLEYKIDAPADVVVTDWANRQYLKVFNFLWRIKRVEFVLATTWRKTMTGARGVLQSADEQVSQTWKTTRGVIGQMIHFVCQLQYYILFEVIESSWAEFQKEINKENCTLDDIIQAHNTYLVSVTHKGLLGAKQKGQDGNDNHFMKQLGVLLRDMLIYRDAVDGLYSWAVMEFTRRQQASVRVETLNGDPDVNSDDDHPRTPMTTRRGPRHLPEDNMTPMPGDIPGLGLDGNSQDDFAVLRERLDKLGGDFGGKISKLLTDLAYQPNVDMRFLGVVMNFNDYYKLIKRSTRSRN